MSRGSRWALLAVLYAIWLLVPAAVFGHGYGAGGGFNDPCLGGDVLSPTADEGRNTTQRDQLWPPLSVRCTVRGPDGLTAQRTFPGPITYAGVVALLAAPFVLWPVLRRLARGA